jgi:hypothetical protein
MINCSKGFYEQIKEMDKSIKIVSKETIEKDILNFISIKPNIRKLTFMTGEFGMHEFHFNVLGTSMGIKSSYLKTSDNYGGHILDEVNKVYFRWKADKIQYFVSTLNNKILFIGKTLTEALEFHKNKLNGK